MASAVRTTLVFLAIALAAGLLVLSLAWLFLDFERFKPRVEAMASEAIGMTVVINGPMTARLFPRPRLTLEDLEVSQDEQTWLILSRLDLDTTLPNLIRGRTSLVRAELVDPEFNLVRHERGRFNFLPPEHERGRARDGFSVERIQLSGGSVRYVDQPSGEELEGAGCEFSGRELAWEETSQRPVSVPRIRGSVRCQTVAYRQLSFSGPGFRLDMDADGWRFDELEGRLFEGQLGGYWTTSLEEAGAGHELEMTLVDFSFGHILRTFAPDEAGDGGQGEADFRIKGNSRGLRFDDMVRTLDGEAILSGEELVLFGQDLDAELERYETTQRFELVDAGAMFLAGPAGLAVARGYGFASLFQDSSDQTRIREVVSEWDIHSGVATARDVALATEANRIAVAGHLDFPNSRFDDLTVAVIDGDGCSIVEQTISGSFEDPEIAALNFLVAATLGPLIDLLEQGWQLLTGTECDPFYTGRVAAP